MIFLGLRPENGEALFATALPATDEDLADRTDLQLIDLRTLALQNAFAPQDMGALAQARALIHWHRTISSARAAARKAICPKPDTVAIAHPAAASIFRAQTPV